MSTTALTRIEQATRALEQATDIRDVARIHDEADVLRMYARRFKLGLDAQNQAAALRLRAARAGGEMLIQTAENGERRRRGGDQGKVAIQTLADLGIDKHTSAYWQQIAAVPPETFEMYLTWSETRHELTTAGLLAKRTGFVGFSSESAERYTPRAVIDATLAVLGRIDLDPCAEPTSMTSNVATGARTHNIPAFRHYTAADNGLAQPWIGTVYMNPPYGDEIPLWIEKLVEEHREGRTTAAVALTPARTDTAWFRMMRDFPVCFVSGRLVFGTPEGEDFAGQSAPFPSAIFALGVPRKLFLQVFGQLGDVYDRVRR